MNLLPMIKFFNLKSLFLTLPLSLIIFSTQAQPGKPANAKPMAKGKPAAEKPMTSPKETQRKWSVYFDVNQSKIKSNDYKVLDSVIHVLKTQTNVRRIQINGYADTTGGAEANMILSDNRTDTVAGYILSHDLMSYKNKTTTASLGEKVTGKETDLNEMRRVDIVLYMARPDRDTLIKVGCASAFVKANTFDGFNNDEVTFKIEYVKSIEEAKKYNLSFKDNDGNNLVTSGAVRITAMYRGKPVKATKPVVVTMPKANAKTGYSLYKGTEDKSKNITWKKTDNMVTEIPKSSGTAAEDDCGAKQSTSITDFNVWFCAGMKLDCHCSADPFGGIEAPTQDEALARFGPDQSIVLLNDACFKKIGADKAYVQVADNLFPGEFLNFCNSFLLPGVGDVPEIPKFDREIVKFIDFNVSQKNDSADLIMVKKTKILIMIPKSKYPAHTGKQYAMLPADTKKDNFLTWTNKIVFNDACQGLVNCDYWVFEVPFSGFYTLLELTPNEDNNPKKKKNTAEGEEGGPAPKYLTIKTKKFNNVHVIYGLKENDKTETATFVKNKGKHSYNMPAITKKEKKEYREHVFMAYVIKDGKRYAWIGKGKQLKTGFLSGKWKTPKLVYVPDEEWENFVRKACE